jgi:predicted HTH domain antitoxin
MHQHALETAASLYESGTYTLSMAATQAGVDESRVLDCLARRGVDVEGTLPERPEAGGRAAAD